MKSSFTFRILVLLPTLLHPVLSVAILLPNPTAWRNAPTDYWLSVETLLPLHPPPPPVPIHTRFPPPSLSPTLSYPLAYPPDQKTRLGSIMTADGPSLVWTSAHKDVWNGSLDSAGLVASGHGCGQAGARKGQGNKVVDNRRLLFPWDGVGWGVGEWGGGGWFGAAVAVSLAVLQL